MSQNNPLTSILAREPFVLLDGAMATELEARGCNLADSLWSARVLLENPQLIRDVHLDYFRAGAQVAITASYQATPAGFAACGLDEAQSKALIGKSVELARKAREACLAENPQAGTLLVRRFGGAVRRLSLPMVRNIAAITSAARKSFRPSIARAWKRFLMPEPICWPAKPCRHLPKLRRWRCCWLSTRVRAPGSHLPCATPGISATARR
ncbi:Homocysteine S-methyltransferase [Raoultella terrigena]|uniref:Homocysteine S-methyltransferase n=1 Tax=Raoultella terrigena TaxID=577 RepID=A0A3P8JR01_RAOTE|nr:Homocysteine S-methyltransferase [Raoultella terrigena]